MAWREASAPVTAPSPPVETELPSPAPVMVAPIPAPRPVASPNPIEQPSAVEPATPTPSAAEPKTLPPTTHSQTPNTVEPLPEAAHTLAASPTPTLTPKALNGHADTGAEMDTQSQEPYPLAPSLSPTQPQASALASREDCSEAVPSEVRAEMPPAIMDPIAPITVMPVTLTSSPAPAVPAPPPGLPPLVQATAETSKLSDTKDIPLKAGTETLITPNSKLEPQLQALFRKSPTTGMCIAMDTDMTAWMPHGCLCVYTINKQLKVADRQDLDQPD